MYQILCYQSMQVAAMYTDGYYKTPDTDEKMSVPGVLIWRRPYVNKISTCNILTNKYNYGNVHLGLPLGRIVNTFDITGELTCIEKGGMGLAERKVLLYGQL